MKVGSGTEGRDLKGGEPKNEAVSPLRLTAGFYAGLL